MFSQFLRLGQLRHCPACLPYAGMVGSLSYSEECLQWLRQFYGRTLSNHVYEQKKRMEPWKNGIPITYIYNHSFIPGSGLLALCSSCLPGLVSVYGLNKRGK